MEGEGIVMPPLARATAAHSHRALPPQDGATALALAARAGHRETAAVLSATAAAEALALVLWRSLQRVASDSPTAAAAAAVACEGTGNGTNGVSVAAHCKGWWCNACNGYLPLVLAYLNALEERHGV